MGGRAGGSRRAGGMSRRANVIAVCVLVVCVAGAYALWRAWSAGAGSAGDLVAVVVDMSGEETVLALDEDSKTTFSCDDGYNTVVVSDGEVWVDEADCPNQDCVEMGHVGSVGEEIVCLPHELVIEVKSDTEEADYDVMGR